MKKILITIPILSAFLSVLLLFSSFSVKANDVVFPAFPLPVEGESSTHYIIISQPSLNRYKLFKPLDPNNIFISQSGSDNILNFGGPALCYLWSEGESTWNYYNLVDDGVINTLYSGQDIVLYSSFSLLYEDGTIFFQRAPIKANFLTQMKEVEMGATLTTLVSLVPLLMALVISFLAFRKALAWLLKVLHKA